MTRPVVAAMLLTFVVGKYGDWTANITPDFGGSPDGSVSLYEANINYSGFKPVTATVGSVNAEVAVPGTVTESTARCSASSAKICCTCVPLSASL